MADHRDLAGLKYGQAGNLVYIPRELGASEPLPGRLHASRRILDVPSFQITSPWEHCYTSSQYPDATDEAISYSVKRTQKRWLHHAHPETIPGLATLTNILDEETRPSTIASPPHVTPDTPPFELGTITGLAAPASSRKRPSGGIPVIAKASGHAGELLHILRLQNHWYQWPDSKEVSVRLRTTALLDKQEEVFWSADVTPITGIKFAIDLDARRPRRWLIVQKVSGTTILQPEHHDVPVPVLAAGGAGAPSRISPRPLVHISSKDTGGRGHSDLAFMPTVGERRAQLAIVDDMGYWTIWEIRGAATTSYNSVKVEQAVCGQINQGILPSLADPMKFPQEHYGVSFRRVDREVPDTSSHAVIVWNDSNVVAYDLNSQEVVMTPPRIFPLRRTSEFILDIQPDPTDNSRLFILTPQKLLWIGYVRNHETDQLESQNLLVTTHYLCGDDDTVQMTSTPIEDTEDGSAVLVALHSTMTRALKTFWFRQYPDSKLAQLYQRDFIVEGRQAEDIGSAESMKNTYALKLSHCSWGAKQDVDPTVRKPPSARFRIEEPESEPVTTGALLRDNHTSFHQMFTLAKNGQIGYWLCATAPLAPQAPIPAPTVNVYSLANRWAQIIHRRKKAYTDFITPAFVIPDGLEDYENLAMAPLKRRTESAVVEDKPEQVQRLKRKFMGMWAEVMERFVLKEEGGMMEFHSSAITDRIAAVVNAGIQDGRLSYRTLFECISHAHTLQKYAMDDEIWTGQLAQALDFEENSLVITTVSHQSTFNTSDVLNQLQNIAQDLTKTWPDPNTELPAVIASFRRSLFDEIARDLILSSTVISIIPNTFDHPDDPEDEPISSQPDFASSSQLQSSQYLPTPASSSQPSQHHFQKDFSASAACYTAAQEALRRLSTFTTISTTSSLSKTPPHPVLASWPKESGITTDSYITPEMRARMAREDTVRKKQEAINARRWKQAAKLGLKAEDLPSTSQIVGMGPPKVVAGRNGGMSQGGFVLPSSQSYGVSQGVVTQPVGGRFGGAMGLDKKKKKKKKTKGGIK